VVLLLQTSNDRQPGSTPDTALVQVFDKVIDKVVSMCIYLSRYLFEWFCCYRLATIANLDLLQTLPWYRCLIKLLISVSKLAATGL